MELQNTQHTCNVRAVSTVGILRRISGQCRHQSYNATPLVRLGFMSATWPHRNGTVFARIGIILSVVISSYTVQIQVKHFVQLSQYLRLKASLWLVQWCPLNVSMLSQINSFDMPLPISLIKILILFLRLHTAFRF